VIVHLASYDRVLVDRLDKMGTHVNPRIKAKASETRDPANNGLRRRRLGDQNGHPWKWYWGRWWNQQWKWRNNHGHWGNGSWWEYHLWRGGNHLSRERWDQRRFDGVMKDIGHFRIGIEDGRTKGEWVVERGSIGAL
jgi:hypothetical protein